MLTSGIKCQLTQTATILFELLTGFKSCSLQSLHYHKIRIRNGDLQDIWHKHYYSVFLVLIMDEKTREDELARTVKFSPPLYKQRYQFIKQLVSKHKPRKVGICFLWIRFVIVQWFQDHDSLEAVLLLFLQEFYSGGQDRITV